MTCKDWIYAVYYCYQSMETKTKIFKKYADQAGLVYVHDTFPGIKRTRKGRGFAYYTPKGILIKDKCILDRIKKLGIPPAYENVWICPFANGHIQATGLDKKLRKQYRYHPKWTSFRQEFKHQKMISFGQSLSKIRARVSKDMNSEVFNKTKVLATIVRIMDKTLIRVGNERYAKENESYGLTTILKKHVIVEDQDKGYFKFEFTGKSGKHHDVEIHSKKLFGVVDKCLEVPGHPLFQFLDHRNQIHDVTSDDVNKYLKNISGEDFTAKDFRTWWGTVFTMIALDEIGVVDTNTNVKKALTKAVKFTSEKLRNTPSVCKKFYIYPGIMESFSEGRLSPIIEEFKNEKPKHGLSHEEWWTLQFLQRKNDKS